MPKSLSFCVYSTYFFTCQLLKCCLVYTGMIDFVTTVRAVKTLVYYLFAFKQPTPE